MSAEEKENKRKEKFTSERRERRLERETQVIFQFRREFDGSARGVDAFEGSL